MYQPCPVCDAHYSLSQRDRIGLSKTFNIDDVVATAINQLFDEGKIDAATKKALFESHNAPLQKAVQEGFVGKVEYNTPNYEFLKQLQTNTAIFAMFKSHASIKNMVSLLKDDNGNVRTKADFIKQAKLLDNTYRTQYLDVEYDTAVRTARLASQWAKFEKNKRIYPNLKYLLSKAAKPDEKHLKFVGIVRPVDDAFWNAHYPPNRWRCQCSVEQTRDDATDIPDNLPPVAKGFEFNAGKQGQIFDVKNSDYAKAASPKEQMDLIKKATKFVDVSLVKDIPYQPFYESKKGNKVVIHPAAYNNNDIDAVQKRARELANLKDGPKLIQILPHAGDIDTRKIILPDAKGFHNPDYRIDGKIYDLKIPTGSDIGKRTIKNLLKVALSQGTGAVLVIAENYTTDRQLYEAINGQLKQNKYKEFSLFLNYNKEWRQYNQEDWIKYFEVEKIKYRGKKL